MTPLPAPDADDVRLLRKFGARFAGPMPVLRGADWAKEGFKPRGHHHSPTGFEWYIQCHLRGMQTLDGVVEVDPDKRGGVPVLIGTRFTVAQIFAELADTNGVEEVATAFDLDVEAIRALLEGISLLMQKQKPCLPK